MKALALVALLTGCSWFRGTVEPDANAVYDCAKTQATAANIEDIVATVVSAVAAGTVTQAVESLATKYGTAIVACSLAALETQPKGSASMAAVDPVGIAAAQQLSLHGWRTK